MDRDSFKAFKQARKSMSNSESSTNTSSEPMDGSSGSPKRYAHGSEIGEALREFVLELRAEAEHWIPKHRDIENQQGVWCEEGVMEACDKILKRMNELKADAATSGQEEGIPTS